MDEELEAALMRAGQQIEQLQRQCEALRAERDAAAVAMRERCAQVADEHAKCTFPYSSENSHIYHAQADWAEAIAKSIRQMRI